MEVKGTSGLKFIPHWDIHSRTSSKAPSTLQHVHWAALQKIKAIPLPFELENLHRLHVSKNARGKHAPGVGVHHDPAVVGRFSTMAIVDVTLLQDK